MEPYVPRPPSMRAKHWNGGKYHGITNVGDALGTSGYAYLSASPATFVLLALGCTPNGAGQLP
jgi:hypothetical protein